MGLLLCKFNDSFDVYGLTIEKTETFIDLEKAIEKIGDDIPLNNPRTPSFLSVLRKHFVIELKPCVCIRLFIESSGYPNATDPNEAVYDKNVGFQGCND